MVRDARERHRRTGAGPAARWTSPRPPRATACRAAPCPGSRGAARGARRGAAPRAGRASCRSTSSPGWRSADGRRPRLPSPTRSGSAVPPGGPTADRAPDSLAAGTPEPLRGDLNRTARRAARCCARAIDLSATPPTPAPTVGCPRAVVMARSAQDVAACSATRAAPGTPLNFRGGGTSLNGQAQSDGIIVDVRRWFSGVRVEDGGARASASSPGRSWAWPTGCSSASGHRLGPDPAQQRHRHDRRRDRQQLRRHALRRHVGLLLDGRVDDARARRPARSSTPRRPTPSSVRQRRARAAPRACSTCARELLADRAARGARPRASMRSRTSPGTGCARCSTPTRRWRSSAGWSSVRRGRSRSSPRP